MLDTITNLETAAQAEPVFQLTYVSRARAQVSRGELIDLVSRANNRNKQLRISGALLYHDRHFVQLLEGAESAVTALMHDIKKDARHDDLQIISTHHLPRRSFAGWGMHLVPLDGTPDLNTQVFHLLNGSLATRAMAFDHDVAPLVRAYYRRWLAESGNDFMADRQPVTDDKTLSEAFRALMRADDNLFHLVNTTRHDGIWFALSSQPYSPWTNANLRNYFGYNTGDYDHDRSWWRDALAADDRKRLELAIGDFTAQPGQTIDLLMRGHHRSGRPLWFRCRLHSLRCATSGRDYCVGLVVDMGSGAEACAQADSMKQCQDLQFGVMDQINTLYNDMARPIQGLSGLLHQIAGGGLDPAQARAIDAALACVDTLEERLRNQARCNKEQASVDKPGEPAHDTG